MNLTGAGYIRFVSIVLAVGAAFLTFDVFLQVRKVAADGKLNPHPFFRSLLYGLSLAFIAFFLWRYSGAILDFPETKATGADVLSGPIQTCGCVWRFYWQRICFTPG